MTRKAKKTVEPKGRRVNPEESEKVMISRRSMFYAICLFVVYQLMLIPLQSLNYPVYWMAAVFGFFLVFAELVYSQVGESRRELTFGLPHLRELHWRESMLHHIIIPALLYGSGVLFLFFNRVRILDQVAVVLLSSTFFVILYNISAANLNMYRVERSTRVLYDYVNIIVFYFCVDVLINLMLYYGLPEIIVLVGASLVTLMLISLMVGVSRQWSLEIVFMLILTALLMGGIVFALWNAPLFNVAVVSLVATVAFYLFDVYWHHQLEGSFTWDAMSQYVLFAIMALILLLYM